MSLLFPPSLSLKARSDFLSPRRHYVVACGELYTNVLYGVEGGGTGENIIGDAARKKKKRTNKYGMYSAI